MQDTDSESDYTSSTVESSSFDENEEVAGKMSMRGKITERDPNFEKKKKCKCDDGACNSRSCGCYKFGSGCVPSCGCTASCANMFNHLDHFFGKTKKKSDASPCFAKWLIENGNSEVALKSINPEDLKQRIMNSGSHEDLLDDDDYKKWKHEEDKITAGQKLGHTQKLLRLILSHDPENLYYFSFCQDDLYNNDNAWHCITCQTCQEWDDWHCGQCDKCVSGMKCDGCGGKCVASSFFG